VEGALSSLVVGERLISRCDDGLLLAEYALFEPAEVTLSGAAGHGVREQGYFTTAERARERLRAAGITPEIVDATFRAMRPRFMRALARSPSVLVAVDRLGPYEVFEGGVYHSETRRYRGTWLDLDALASACPIREASVVFQAVHLYQVMAEVPDDVPVRLLTANATGTLRVGERTWQAVSFDAAPRLPGVLVAMRVPPRKRPLDDEGGEVREDLLRNLRARSAASKQAEPRILSLATLVARTGKTPPPGPLASSSEDPPPAAPPAPVSRAPESPVVTVEAETSEDLPLPIEMRLWDGSLTDVDPGVLFEELRGHTQLLKGEDHLRAVAEYLTSIAARTPGLPELRVLAARAWLAAGEAGHARHFARRLAEDVRAPDEVRLLALEIVETTASQESLPPPVVVPEPIVPAPILLASPHQHFAPSGASLPPQEHVPFQKAPSVSAMAAPNLPRTDVAPPSSVPTAPVLIVEAGPAYAPRPVTSSALVALRPPPQVDSEIVESLALPPGLTDAMLPSGAKPATPDEARIAMTRLSRWLGRDYRLWYGTTLMTSVIAIEAMQRHIRRRFHEGTVEKEDAEKVEWELMRHGALLSEILARALGGVWVDVPVEKPGHWAMVLYPDIRVWPIGRIYRFFQQGHREADLVAFYLDLEAQVRRSA
jgi:hypothetical protein